MGLFKKKQKEAVKLPEAQKPPELPKLPKLPDIPGIEKKKEGLPRLPKASVSSAKSTHKLPSYPRNALGERFSQDTIKEAVTGKKEVEGFGEDEFAQLEEEARRIPKPPLRKPMIREFEEAGPAAAGRAEPVFIRIDKFEESLKIFEKAKHQISAIERLLSDIKRIKDDEDRELGKWEKEIQSLKQQIEKIDKDVFSRIE